jgi:hypothetical protein
MHSSEVPNRLLTAGTRHVLKSVSWEAMIGGLSAAMPRKTGSLASETPRLPGGSAVSSPPTAVRARNQADRSSASPETEQSGQGKNASDHSCAHPCFFISGPLS